MKIKDSEKQDICNLELKKTEFDWLVSFLTELKATPEKQIHSVFCENTTTQIRPRFDILLQATSSVHQRDELFEIAVPLADLLFLTDVMEQMLSAEDASSILSEELEAEIEDYYKDLSSEYSTHVMALSKDPSKLRKKKIIPMNIFIDAKLLIGMISAIWEHEKKFEVLDALFRNKDHIVLTQSVVETVRRQTAFPSINPQDVDVWISASPFTIVTTSDGDSSGDYFSKKSIIEALAYPEYQNEPCNILSFEDRKKWEEIVGSSTQYIFSFPNYMMRKLRQRELSHDGYETMAECYKGFMKTLKESFSQEEITEKQGKRDWQPSPELLLQAINLMKEHPLNLWDKLKEAEKLNERLANNFIEETEIILTNALSTEHMGADAQMRMDLFTSIRKKAKNESEPAKMPQNECRPPLKKNTLHKPIQWKDWRVTPEIISEAINLMKKHPLDLWNKLKEAERNEKALKNTPLDEMNAITVDVLSKHSNEVDAIKIVDVYLSLRKAARDECGIVDKEDNEDIYTQKQSVMHKSRQWEVWNPTPEILAETIDLMKNHPLDLWGKIKAGEKDENALKEIPLDEVHAITSNMLSKNFGTVDEMKRFYLYLAVREKARRECGIIDED